MLMRPGKSEAHDMWPWGHISWGRGQTLWGQGHRCRTRSKTLYTSTCKQPHPPKMKKSSKN